MKLSYLQHLQLRARADRACGTIFQGPPVLESAPAFVVDGAGYTLAEMLAASADDADLCAWLINAKPGDHFPAHLECRCAA